MESGKMYRLHFIRHALGNEVDARAFGFDMAQSPVRQRIEGGLVVKMGIELRNCVIL